MTLTLTDLPQELLVFFVANYLSTSDLGSLRLTCKRLETCLFDQFAKEFFVKKQFMVTTPSLKALDNISKHAALSKKVQHLIIGLEDFAAMSSTAHEDWTKAEAYNRHVADQRHLLATGRWKDLILEAFKGLPNLQTLGIRDYSAGGRYRDNTRWYSYGSATVFKETGVRLSCNSQSRLGIGGYDFASKVFATLLCAMFEARKVVPQMEVIMRTSTRALEDYCFAIPPASNVSPDTQPILAEMQTLFLTVQGHNTLVRNQAIISGATSKPPLHNPLLVNFLASCTGLKHLRLNFEGHNQLLYGAAPTLLEEIAAAGSLSLHHLKTLDVGMTQVVPEVLLRVISSFAPTLRSVSLWKVSLLANLPRYDDDDGKRNPWRFFFGQLLQSNTIQLEQLVVGCLTYSLDNSTYAVRFQSQIDNVTPEKPFESKGDKETYIPYLINQLRPQWPPEPITDFDESDMEEDEDFGEEEMEEEV